MGPSGRARRVLLIGRVLLEEPAGEEGDISIRARRENEVRGPRKERTRWRGREKRERDKDSLLSKVIELLS